MQFNQSSAATHGAGGARSLIILGGGPAGLAAAIYAGRANLNPLVLAGPEPGGQAALTFTIENYPGFPDGVGGADLSDLFLKQAVRFGAQIEGETAVRVDLSKRPFRVQTESTEYMSDALVVAVGASPRKLDVPGEREFTGRGVSYCATCDGFFFKGKRVAVVGGGDSALEEALFLTRHAESVTVLHRRDSFRAGKLLQERAARNPKVSFRQPVVVEEILGKEKVTGVRLRNAADGSVRTLETDGVFIFIGHEPNTGLFRDQLDMDEKGYLRTDGRMRASVEGVFAAGEAADSVFRQVATSSGMGVAAAISAERWLAERE